ncbi:MAG TPA: 6,7-dimethyl-8-ribityllumazine synthase, partial [Bacteroidales bacterium]|nr:6,7-dimethyl-8-ribityllumazine synthase [Bacteroidales bacterium]
MVEKKKNLSEISSFKLSPTLKKRSIAIIYSEWNSEVTESLKKGAYQTLLEYGIKKQQIKVYSVP